MAAGCRYNLATMNRQTYIRLTKQVNNLALVAMLGFFSTLLGTGLVLCVCHDGHITIEAQCNPSLCCPEDGADFASSGPAVYTGIAAAHPCVDLGVDREYFRAGRSRSDEGVLSAQRDVNGALPLLRSIPVATNVPVRPLLGTMPLTDLHVTRTVVLTI